MHQGTLSFPEGACVGGWQVGQAAFFGSALPLKTKTNDEQNIFQTSLLKPKSGDVSDQLGENPLKPGS